MKQKKNKKINAATIGLGFGLTHALTFKKNKLVILDFATPEVHKTNNSFCRSNLIMVNNIASKKLKGINFVNPQPSII